jgi:transposase
MATSQLAENQQCSYEVFGKKHYMACTTEATGGWQCALVAALAVAQLPFAVVNPRQVRDFAKATGQLAKTDVLDAGIPAHFADAVRPTPRPLPDETTQQVEALLQRRRQLLEMLVAERHRVALAHAAVRESLAQHIGDLQHMISERDETVATIMRTSPAWKAKDDLLQLNFCNLPKLCNVRFGRGQL